MAGGTKIPIPKPMAPETVDEEMGAEGEDEEDANENRRRMWCKPVVKCTPSITPSLVSSVGTSTTITSPVYDMESRRARLDEQQASHGEEWNYLHEARKAQPK